MASVTPTVPILPARASRGAGGNVPPREGGGGDNRPDSGAPDYRTRLRRARLALLVTFVPISMLFVSFTSAYIVRRGLPTLDPGTNALVHDWLPVQLPTTLFLLNTCVLLLSSVTIEFARRQLARQSALEPLHSIPGVSLGAESRVPWLGVTIVLGLCFLAGQWMAWSALETSGFYVSTVPSSSFVYLLTGGHALHLMGGIIALLIAGAATMLHRPLESRRIIVEGTAWYWHFMAVLWIYILGLLEFAR